MEKPKEELLHLSFNQDQSYLSVGTETGFKVFKCSPFKELFAREFGSGIGIVEMINRTNILAIVGGGKTPRYPRNKLMIWDDCTFVANAAIMKCIIETNCKSEVKAVRLKPDRCIIVLETKVFVFNFADFKVLDLLETCPNPKGLCSVASDTHVLMLALPSKKIGVVEITTQSPNKKQKIEAHKSTICALELSPSGSRLATASEKGTIIRIFDVEKGDCIQQLRRGSEQATIYSLAFEQHEKWLACSSDSGTVHIFALKPFGKEIAKGEDEQSKNKKSGLSFLKVFNSYFDSEWSFAQYKCQDKRTKVGFLAQPNTLAIASTEGKVYIVQFDGEKGGDCVRRKLFDIYSKQDHQE